MASMRAAGIQPSRDTYTALLGMYRRGEQWDRLEQTVRAMRQAGMHPNADVYNTLLDAYATNEQWTQLESLLAAVRAAGLPPRLETYNTLVRAVCSDPSTRLLIFRQRGDHRLRQRILRTQMGWY